MPDLEVVLRGFVGWANEQNGSVSFGIGTDSSGDLVLPMPVSEPFAIGLGIADGEFQLVAANMDEPDLQLKKGIGSKFKNPQTLGIEISKHLLSFAQEAERREEKAFEQALLESSAEIALTIGSDLYSGLALTTLGLLLKESDDVYLGFLFTSAAVSALNRADNDDMLAMAQRAREACWAEYSLEDSATVTKYREPMKAEFIKLAESFSAEQLAEATGHYIRTISPLLSGVVSKIDDIDVDAWTLIIESEGTEMVRGVILADLEWKLAERDISGIEIDWHFHKGLIGDSLNPDEAAFTFLLKLIEWNNKYQASGNGRDSLTKLTVSSIYGYEDPMLIQSMALVAISETIIGTVLVGLLEIVDSWERLPYWFEEESLTEAINSYAERYETSFFLDHIFGLASTAGFGFTPRG